LSDFPLFISWALTKDQRYYEREYEWHGGPCDVAWITRAMIQDATGGGADTYPSVLLLPRNLTLRIVGPENFGYMAAPYCRASGPLYWWVRTCWQTAQQLQLCEMRFMYTLSVWGLVRFDEMVRPSIRNARTARMPMQVISLAEKLPDFRSSGINLQLLLRDLFVEPRLVSWIMQTSNRLLGVLRP
jgi:hypothetical protein